MGPSRLSLVTRFSASNGASSERNARRSAGPSIHRSRSIPSIRRSPKGVAEEGRQAVLRTEIRLVLGHVEINGEVGRNFVEHGHGNWIYGLAGGLEVSEGLG